jgi:L-threonylcarbamoyladenylate synthase
VRVIDCADGRPLTRDEEAAVAETVRGGGLILFPTDTLYGLGADPLSPAGLAALFRLKGRDPGKPVPVLLSDAAHLGRYAAAVPGPWRVLMARFWPGPLTLLFPAVAGLPPGIRSASGTVALRVPGGALCRAVLAAAGGSLTGTSANPAGAAGSGDPAAALRALGGGVDLFVNGGTLPGSLASTILDVDAAGGVATVRGGAVAESAWRDALERRDGAGEAG